MLLSMERTIAFPIPVGERVKVATAYIQRFIDALAIESRARKRLLRQSEALKAIYDDGGKPSADELKKLQRSVRRWIKTAKTAASVIGEQTPEE